MCTHQQSGTGKTSMADRQPVLTEEPAFGSLGPKLLISKSGCFVSLPCWESRPAELHDLARPHVDAANNVTSVVQISQVKCPCLFRDAGAGNNFSKRACKEAGSVSIGSSPGNRLTLHFRMICGATGLICDQSVMLTGFYQAKDYPDKLRRVKYYDAEIDKILVFLTNNFILPAKTIADRYRCRWQVELFFKWIKQNLRIKIFYGTSENAVKAQI